MAAGKVNLHAGCTVGTEAPLGAPIVIYYVLSADFTVVFIRAVSLAAADAPVIAAHINLFKALHAKAAVGGKLGCAGNAELAGCAEVKIQPVKAAAALIANPIFVAFGAVGQSVSLIANKFTGEE